VLMNEYANEKLRQLDDERLSHTLIETETQDRTQGERPRGKPVIGPALRAAGRTLRRVGAGLEHWAEPTAPETDQIGLERRSL
jgi:hypothetical protein